MVYRYDVCNLGNNSVQVAEFGGYENITSVEIYFRGSGAIDDFEFQTTSTGTEPVTWGGLKSKYR